MIKNTMNGKKKDLLFNEKGRCKFSRGVTNFNCRLVPLSNDCLDRCTCNSVYSSCPFLNDKGFENVINEINSKIVSLEKEIEEVATIKEATGEGVKEEVAIANFKFEMATLLKKYGFGINIKEIQGLYDGDSRDFVVYDKNGDEMFKKRDIGGSVRDDDFELTDREKMLLDMK